MKLLGVFAMVLLEISSNTLCLAAKLNCQTTLPTKSDLDIKKHEIRSCGIDLVSGIFQTISSAILRTCKLLIYLMKNGAAEKN